MPAVRKPEVKNIADNLQTLQKQEAEFARTHKNDTDDELIAYLVKCSKELGRCPKKDKVIGHTYLKARLGPWPRILERAGLKEKSQKRIEKEQKKYTDCYRIHFQKKGFICYITQDNFLFSASLSRA